MDLLIDILKSILTPIVAGVITFFITKYTYGKNGPLDKLEIAYNRVYYPIYRMIYKIDIKTVKAEDIDLVVKQAKYYIDKYAKYVDLSTIRAFNTLCQSDSVEKKEAYSNFQYNINDKSSYLRRRLGYLEPNIIQLYKYLSASTRSFIRICGEGCLLYVSIFLYYIPIAWVQEVSVYAFAFLFVVILFEVVRKVTIDVWKVICRIWRKLKER